MAGIDNSSPAHHPQSSVSDAAAGGLFLTKATSLLPLLLRGV